MALRKQLTEIRRTLVSTPIGRVCREVKNQALLALRSTSMSGSGGPFDASPPTPRRAGRVAEYPYYGDRDPSDVFPLAPADPNSSFLPCSESDVERWNAEWFVYLQREWEMQFTPSSCWPSTPPLPTDPLELLRLRVDGSDELSVFARPEWLADRSIMELGCGCGNFGKVVSRYVRSYLGVDFSTLALAIARLVSPKNATYIHVADHPGLTSRFGTVDTVIGRHFWIHQNLELGKRTLRFLSPFLVNGGRIVADFYWPDPASTQFIVLPPSEPLSKRWPSATFAYREEDISALIDGSPFRIAEQTVHLPSQRRYVVLEKQVG